jgi:Superfamily II helicase and inactivated derivatives
VKEILQEGKLLGVLLTASVSSILIKPLNISGITVILAGNSGAGKTTSSLIATSLFYYSDDVLLNAQTTKVGLEFTISSLNSLPVLIDEGALADLKLSLNDLVFMVSSGKGRTRGTKDLKVNFKELKSNVFWTTEATDIDNLRRTGAFRRLLYLVVNSWNDLTELFKPEDRINEQYAGCGIDYIQYLIEHMEDVRKAFKEETKDFSFKYKEITTLASNLYAGLILLEKFYNTKFTNLRKTINKVLDDAKGLFLENKENVVQIFKDFLIANTTLRFHMVNANGMMGEKLSNRDIWGEYDANTQTYYILASSFKEISKELGKERNLLVEELIKAGVLKDKNVSYWMKSIKQPAKVYILSFGSDKEETKTDSNAINDSVKNDEIVDF